MTRDVDAFMQRLDARNPQEPEFRRAVEEFVSSVMPWYREHLRYREAAVLERLTEPDRIVSFRVTWQCDDGSLRSDRAWRVQFSNALGPYKGGLRFHESVTQSVLKFLAFEQTFKNSLTGLPMGGAKGGAAFSAKGKSEAEVMRFCQALMSELQHYIGENIDVPAGDIGVHDREIGYLFGQYMRLKNRWSGVLTSKGCAFGGSAVRNEATGYGCVYFCEHMLNHHGSGLAEQRVAISGSGTVALHAAEKVIERGAKVVTLSDSDGVIYKQQGLTETELADVMRLKSNPDARLRQFAEKTDGVEYHAGRRPWCVPCDIAMPCATQNELDVDDARTLVDNGARAVCEGANMPATEDAAAMLRKSKILYAPGKAANAGGVAVSGLEQSQNAMRLSWPREVISERLQSIMRDIHAQCLEYGEDGSTLHPDYVVGANVAGLKRVADALSAYGAI